MSDPTTDILVRTSDRQDSSANLSAQDFKLMMEYIQHNTPRYVKVKGKPKGSTNTDEYLVDIYDKGYTTDPNIQDVKAYSIDIKQSFAADSNGNWGAHSRIIMLPDGTGIFLPPVLPSDVGQYKVLMLIDQQGTPFWDYPRFSI